MHTKVKWLSKGNCLNHFITLWDAIISFLDDCQFTEKLLAAKYNTYYLAEIFEILNLLNKQPQGQNSNLISCKESINAFIRKPQLYKTNISCRALEHFSSLALICNDLYNVDLALYGKHL